jgi:hypothetical protein
MSSLEFNIRERYADRLKKLKDEREAIRSEGIKALQVVWNQIAEQENALVGRARPVLEAMAADLTDEVPDVTEFDWPEPVEGTEHGDPLFDSARSYIEQVERYHVHQGKTPDAQYKGDRRTVSTCVQCGTTFTTPATSIPKTFCSKDCQLAAGRSKREVKSYNLACIICDKNFSASRSTARVCGGTCEARLRVRRLNEETQQAEPRKSLGESVSEDGENISDLARLPKPKCGW